jgi:hypothetical protein
MRRAWFLALSLLVGIAGCGERHDEHASALHFELQKDTTNLSSGRPVLQRVEAARADDGVLRVRGDVDLPDGVRLQISLYPHGTEDLAGRVQVVVQHRRFETPPVIGSTGPLPRGRYRVEYLALFNAAWQSPDVMRATHDGKDLRGPGITRDRAGGAAFYLVEERRL